MPAPCTRATMSAGVSLEMSYSTLIGVPDDQFWAVSNPHECNTEFGARGSHVNLQVKARQPEALDRTVSSSQLSPPEEELSDSEVRYRRLFETAQDGILILDAETGLITDVNPFLVRLLGYSREEFLGKALGDMGLFKDIEASKRKAA